MGYACLSNFRINLSDISFEVENIPGNLQPSRLINRLIKVANRPTFPETIIREYSPIILGSIRVKRNEVITNRTPINKEPDNEIAQYFFRINICWKKIEQTI